MGVIHFAKLEKSERLQRVLAVLMVGGAYTTLQISRRANVCAVNSCIAELRENGYDIKCKQIGGPKAPEGERFEYTLTP